MIYQGSRPRFSAIRALRDKNVVEVCARPLLNAGLASGVHVVNVVRERISDDRSLIIVERGIASVAALRDHWIAHLRPGEAVIVGALHVDQRAIPCIVVGNEITRAIRRDPAAIRARRVNDLRLAAPRNAGSREREARAADRGDAQLESGQRWRRYKNQSRGMERAR